MPTLNLQPEYLSEEESSIIASRRILSFLNVASLEESGVRLKAQPKPAPSKSLFSLGALPEETLTDTPIWFNWKTREIYDVDDRLLFRDHFLDLGDSNELRVRTAASDLLRTPVWSVKAGRAVDFQSMAERLFESLKDDPTLMPLLVDDEGPRLVAYCYPRLGLLYRSRFNSVERFVIDIAEPEPVPIPLYSLQLSENPDSRFMVWSPYETVQPSTIAQFRSLWERDIALLPALPEAGGDLVRAVLTARLSILEEKTTSPELRLIGQQNETFCAAAAVQMILEQHGIIKTQDEVAAAMKVGPDGATPTDQESAIAILTSKFEGKLEIPASLEIGKEEIRQHRPFKTGVPGHARACGGFKVEDGNQNALYIYDPYPPGQGEIYYEAWTAVQHTNNLYVRPVALS